MTSQQEIQLRGKLTAEVTVSTWKGLIPDMLTRALFMVSADLDLVEVGVHVALDHAARVKEWIDAGKLARPVQGQIAEWENTGSLFRFIVVAPFVFFQEYDAAPR